MKKASRWADFEPMPGSFLNCSISRLTGSAISILEQARNFQSTSQIPELSLHRFIDFAHAFVDGGDDEVLKHVLVSTRENFRVNLNGEQLFLAVHFD